MVEEGVFRGNNVGLPRHWFNKRRRNPVFARGSRVRVGEFRTRLGQNCVKKCGVV